jgi:CheY-like chemotaxis protein
MIWRACSAGHRRFGEVVPAGSGAEALPSLADRRFDALFLDVRMPDLDGLELASLLGQFAEPPSVVFVSAHADGAVGALEFEPRVIDYLMQPISRMGSTPRSTVCSSTESAAPRAEPRGARRRLRASLAAPRLRPRTSQLRRQPAQGRRDPPRAGRRGDRRDDRWRRVPVARRQLAELRWRIRQ